VPPSAVEELFDSFDKDGGGEINFRELNNLLRRNVKKEVKVKKEVHMVKILDVQQVPPIARRAVAHSAIACRAMVSASSRQLVRLSNGQAIPLCIYAYV
jgi:hypothetical protein